MEPEKIFFSGSFRENKSIRIWRSSEELASRSRKPHSNEARILHKEDAFVNSLLVLC